MKRWILALTAVVLALVCMSAMSAQAADREGNWNKDGSITWELNGSTLTIRGTGDMVGMPNASFSGVTCVVIEEGITSVGGLQNRGIEGTFRNLQTVSLPRSVTRIEPAAFKYCINLTDISLPSGVTWIGTSAFQSCEKLEQLDFPSGLTEIGNSAFSGSGLRSVQLPQSLQVIGASAFSDCPNLSSANVPYGVKELSGCFARCPNLTSLYVPDTVTWLGGFAGCAKLAHINIPAGAVVSGGSFTRCECLTSVGPAGNGCSIELEEGAQISASLFQNATSLTEVTIPAWISELGKSAFQGCTSLKKIVIPSTVATIGDGTFASCSGLETASIENGVGAIGAHAFGGCASLRKIVIPSTVAAIGESAFSSCSGLETASFENGPSAVKALSARSFYQCGALKTVDLPDSLSSIGDEAFRGCASLEVVRLPRGLQSLGSKVFYDCDSLTEIDIPGRFGYSCFTNCDSLKHVSIRSGPKTVSMSQVWPDSDSYGSAPTELESLIIPASVSEIGGVPSWLKAGMLKNLFYQGTEADWSRIKLPQGSSSEPSLWDGADFHYITLNDSYYAEKGKKLTVNADFLSKTLEPGDVSWSMDTQDGIRIESHSLSGPVDRGDGWREWTLSVTLEGDPDKGCEGFLTLSLPAHGAVMESHIFFGALESGKCGKDLTWVLYEDGRLVIRGTGAMYDDTDLLGWQDYFEKIQTLIIDDGATSISARAFANCSALRRVDLPDSITDIGQAAFTGCEALLHAAVPNGVTRLPDSAFSLCYRLGSLRIPAGLTEIGANAFKGCSGLTHLYFCGSKADWLEVKKDSAWDQDLITIQYQCDPSSPYDFLQSFQWNFPNLDDPFGPKGNGYHITAADYAVLLSRLTGKTDREALTVNKRKLLQTVYNYHVAGDDTSAFAESFGSCYGMAAAGCLASGGSVDLSWYGGGDSLYDIPFSQDVASKINHYFWQQKLPSVVAAQDAFMQQPQPSQLETLRTLSQACNGGQGDPVLLYYQWRDTSEPWPKNIHAHAVVAYGERLIEGRSFDAVAPGKTFNHVVYLYDNSLQNGNTNLPQYYLYYNGQGEWIIPGKKIVSTLNTLENNKYNNGQLVIATADKNIINGIDYNGVVHIPGTETKVLYTDSSASFQLAGADDLRPICAAGETDESDTMSVVLLDSDSYTLTTQDPGLSFSLYAGDYFLTASADASGTVTFGPAGKVTLQSDSESYALSVTANNSPVSWDTVEIRGNRAANVTLQLTDSGVEITSDEAGTVTVIGITEETRNQQTFSLERGSALVTDQDGVPTLYKACLSGTDRGDGTVDITVDHPSASGKARLIAARYDDQGKMLACAAAEVTLTPNQPLHTVLDLTKGGTEYQETRLFLVDDTGLPLCPAGRVQK